MNGKPFFDTNVLIYALVVGKDPRITHARNLIEAGGHVSVQVLNELVAVLRRKFAKPWKEIIDALRDLGEFCPSPRAITFRTHTKALEIAQRYDYRIYDALVIAAALEASATVLYSEDMRDGQVIEGLTITNPFRSSGRTAPRR